MNRTGHRMLLLLTAVTPLLSAGPVQADDESDHFSELITEGRTYLARSAPGKAEERFREALKLKPRSALARNELGVALFQQGQAKKAIAEFTAAIAADPRLTNARANLAESQLRSGMYREAALSFHKLLQAVPGDARATIGLALCFEGYGELQKALQTLAIARKRAGNDAAMQARIERAVQRVQERVADGRRPAVERGDILFRAGRWDEALSVYQSGLAKAPADPVLLGRRGLVRGVLGRLEDARKDLEAALLRDPAQPDARAAYVAVLAALGLGNPPPPRASEAPALLAMDRAAMAHRAYDAAIRGAPGRPELLLGRGEASLRMGLVALAAADIKAAGAGEAATLARADMALLAGDRVAAEKDLKATRLPMALDDLPVHRRAARLR